MEENQPPRYWHCLATPRLFHLKGSVKDQAAHIGVRDGIYLFINIFFIRFMFACLFFWFTAVFLFCVPAPSCPWLRPCEGYQSVKNISRKRQLVFSSSTEKICVGGGLFTQHSVEFIYLSSLIILINPPTHISHNQARERGPQCLNLYHWW